MSHHRAKVRFLPAAEGGRGAPPTGPAYSTVARFDGVPPEIASDSWSIVLSNSEIHDGIVFANIEFLSPNAPQMLLHEGAQFQLFEGNKIVAIGEMVAADTEAQARLARLPKGESISRPPRAPILAPRLREMIFLR